MLFVPLYVQAAAWDAGFAQPSWDTAVRGALHTPLLTGRQAAVWVHAAAAMPWVVLIVAIGLRFVDPQLEEQALLDGSTPQVFRRVTLRSAAPSVAVAALWVVVATAGEITVTDLYGVRTFAEEVHTGFALGEELPLVWRRALPGASFVAWLGVAAFLMAVALAPPYRSPLPRAHRLFRLGGWRAPAAVAVMALLLLVVVVPLGNLCYKAGAVDTQVDGQWSRSWSLLQLGRVVLESAWLFREEFFWSLAIAAAAASAAVIVAAPLAWRARRGGAGAAAALAVTAVCLAIPGPLVGLAVVWLMNSSDSNLVGWLYNRTVFAPALAVWVRGLPLAILVSWYALQSVSGDVLDAAAVDGAGPLSRFWRIVAPQRCAGFAAAWLAALAIAMSDISASFVTTPPGVTTVSNRVFGLMHAGNRSQVAGICLLSWASFVIVAFAAMWLLGRLRTESARPLR
jgi:ABC-type Fe3+ transport system permease subunit